MFTHTLPSISQSHDQSGAALIIAIIVLVILGALGLAALDVADFNIFVAANDRDSKDAFFHADSGANVGHEYLEVSIENANSTFYGSDATTWMGDTFNATLFPLTIYTVGVVTTYVRSGALDSGQLAGYSAQMGGGYEGPGKGMGTFTNYLIRSHRDGRRNSVAEVDIGWRHIN